jgi:hypothetical protein
MLKDEFSQDNSLIFSSVKSLNEALAILAGLLTVITTLVFLLGSLISLGAYYSDYPEIYKLETERLIKFDQLCEK